MSADFHSAVKKLLVELNLNFEFGAKINPPAQIVYIRPRGVKMVISQSAIDDNPIGDILAAISDRSVEWWLQDCEISINSQLEVRAK